MPGRLRSKNRIALRTRPKLKRVIVLSASVFAFAAIAFTVLFQTKSENVRAAVSGDYRSRLSGNWSVATNWQTFNGSSWITASSAPTASDKQITIQSGHVINANSSINVDEM